MLRAESTARERPVDTVGGAQPPYHLSREQVSFFDENGYLILRKWIPENLLRRLRAAGTAWIDAGMNPNPNDPHFVDYLYREYGHHRVMFRVNYLHNKGQPASLELLGSPHVLAVAESLCGPNFVPTYESMVFKQAGDGADIAWHQDAVHPRTRRIFNFDLYLDNSHADNGALYVIPGSQKEKQDICHMASEYGWSPPGAIRVEMEPGDVLLHDVMVVHGSPQTEGNDLRRTIYYEFRAAEEIVAEGPWDRDWIDRRMRLIPLALQRHREAFPDGDQFQWKVADEFRPEINGTEEQELKVAHVVHSGGTFCSAGDAG